MQCSDGRCLLYCSLLFFAGAVLCVAIFAFTTEILLYIGFVLVFIAAIFGIFYALSRRGKSSSESHDVICCGMVIYSSRPVDTTVTSYDNQVMNDEELANQMAASEKQIQNMRKECVRLNGDLRQRARILGTAKEQELAAIIREQHVRLDTYSTRQVVSEEQLSRVRDRLQQVRYQIQGKSDARTPIRNILDQPPRGKHDSPITSNTKDAVRSGPAVSPSLGIRATDRRQSNESTGVRSTQDIPVMKQLAPPTTQPIQEEIDMHDDSGIMSPPSEIMNTEQPPNTDRHLIPTLSQPTSSQPTSNQPTSNQPTSNQPTHQSYPTRAHRLIRSASYNETTQLTEQQLTSELTNIQRTPTKSGGGRRRNPIELVQPAAHSSPFSTPSHSRQTSLVPRHSRQLSDDPQRSQIRNADGTRSPQREVRTPRSPRQEDRVVDHQRHRRDSPVHIRQTSGGLITRSQAAPGVFAIPDLDHEPQASRDVVAEPLRVRRWGSGQILDEQGDVSRQPPETPTRSTKKDATQRNQARRDDDQEVNQQVQHVRRDIRGPSHQEQSLAPTDRKVNRQLYDTEVQSRPIPAPRHQKNKPRGAETNHLTSPQEEEDYVDSRQHDPHRHKRHRRHQGEAPVSRSTEHSNRGLNSDQRRGRRSARSLVSVGPPSDISGPPAYYSTGGTVV